MNGELSALLRRNPRRARACRYCQTGVVDCFKAWRHGPGRCCWACCHRPRRSVGRAAFVAHALSQGLLEAEAVVLADGAERRIATGARR